MKILKLLKNFVPKPLEVPSRYYYSRILNKIDRELFIIDDKIGFSSRCIDIGANFGTVAYFLSRKCSNVEVFEPLPDCADTLSAYKKNNINVYNLALSDREGTCDLRIPLKNGNHIRGLASLEQQDGLHDIVQVSVMTLDSFKFNNVSFIKIDVEGHEYAVLKGASETIKNQHPVLLIEIEQRHLHDKKAEDVISYILSLGYKGHFLDNNELNSIENFSLKKHQNLNDIGTANYINNFIFIPNAHNIKLS